MKARNRNRLSRLLPLGLALGLFTTTMAQEPPPAEQEAERSEVVDRRARMMEAVRQRMKPGEPVAPATGRVVNRVPSQPAQPAAPTLPPPSPSPFALPSAPAQGDAPRAVSGPDLEQDAVLAETVDPRLTGVSLDLVLEQISEFTGKIVLRDPKVPNATVTLVARKKITKREYLEALNAALAMQNIALVPFREHYLKAVPANTAAASGIAVDFGSGNMEERDKVISKVITLTHLDYQEVQALITERLSPNAKVQPLERSNSVLVTDTENNIRRVTEVLSYIDKPADVREEVKIYPIVHAKASDIKSRIEELIAESQAEYQARGAASRNNAARPAAVAAPRGVIRPGGTAAAPAPSVSSDAAPPGLVRGKVQIVADERTNLLIIISRPENDTFLSEMITALDRKVDPEVVVRNYKLEFADAEEVAATLNDLIGAATGEKQPSAANAPAGNEAGNRTGRSVAEFVSARNANRSAAEQTANPNAAPGSIGDISESTRILADKRTNALLLMGRTADLDLLEGVIRQLDVMLAQVLVRAVIMEVQLTDTFAYGIDWLQNALTVNNVENVNGVPIRTPIAAFGGSQNLNGSRFQDGADVGRDTEFPAGALTYLASLYDFNLDAVISLAAGSSEAKVIATPLIMTTDNTEANIIVGERRAIPSNTQTTLGGSISSSYEYENIGLDLKVTPRINPEGVVLMEVEQAIENVAGDVIIDGNEVPIITTRQLNANVAIQNGRTIVLGGLVREDDRDSVTKVPLLGSIPILGHLFRSKSIETVRTELLVLISPRVLVTQTEAEYVTEYLKSSTEMGDSDWYRGWKLTQDGDMSRRDADD